MKRVLAYDLYSKDSESFVPILIISIIVTLLAYSAFPVSFAKTTNTPITKKKYKKLCYGINAAIMVCFLILNGGVANGAPYFLWTTVFSNYGIKVLGKRGLMQDSEYYKSPEYRFRCDACGYQDTISLDSCPKCGTHMHKYNNPTTAPKQDVPIDKSDNKLTIQKDKVFFCHKCGKKLLENSMFCRKCGTKVVEVSTEKGDE